MVYKNAVNRGISNFQDVFKVTVQKVKTCFWSKSVNVVEVGVCSWVWKANLQPQVKRVPRRG